MEEFLYPKTLFMIDVLHDASFDVSPINEEK
jgi:hypothetical protein